MQQGLWQGQRRGIGSGTRGTRSRFIPLTPEFCLLSLCRLSARRRSGFFLSLLAACFLLAPALGAKADVTVSGTITLDSVVNSQQPITFTFCSTTGINAFTRTQTLNSSGGFTLAGIPTDKYNVAIQGAKWLRKVVAVDASAGNVSNLNVTLLGGDADNNNLVDFNDQTLLAIAYNTSVGNPLYDVRADFTCDGNVDFDDLTVLGINYNVAGDVYARSLTATTGSGSITLSWTGPADATGYRIYRSTSSGSEAYYQTTTNLSFTDNNLTNGSTYYYQVTALNANAQETTLKSNEVGVKVSWPEPAGLTVGTPVVGGNTTTATLTLNQAPTSNIAVSFSCDNPAAVSFVTNPLTIAAGMTSGTVTLNTSTVNYPMTFTIFASYNGGVSQATLTLTPANLRVTDYRMSNTLLLAWDIPNTYGPFTLKRDGTPLATGLSNSGTYTDSLPLFVAGTTYLYQMFNSMDPTKEVASEKVVPYQVSASDNQAVDSRIDPRYSTIVLKDFPFGGRVYRGGLFTGYASDGSKVGRSFARFTNVSAIPTQPPAAYFRTGNMNAFFTGAYISSPTGQATVNVLCQRISDDGWDAPSLKWSTQPVIDQASNLPTYGITYYGTSPVQTWFYFGMRDEIKNALLGNHTLSVALKSVDESAYGWAYFAKKEFGDHSMAPTLTYVWAYPRLINFSLSPNPVTAGQNSTATVVMNGLGPGETASVHVVLTYPNSYQIISDVSISGLTRTFTVPTFSGTDPRKGNVSVQVSFDGVTKTATLTVN